MERILSFRSEAGKYIEALRNEKNPGRGVVRANIRAFVRLRFMLEKGECEAGTFDELTEYSIAKTAQISRELVKEFDTARDCMGSTSAMAKKVLLFRNIEKSLDIALPAMRSAEIVTLDDLGDLVWEELQKKEAL